MARRVKPTESDQDYGSSDSELVALTREGDNSAFAELWRRHYTAGLAVARSFSSSLDPDDLVSEAFARTFKLIGNGGGPTVGFRPYLFTVIRNTAASWGASQEWTSLEQAHEVEDERFSEEALLTAFDQSLAVKAFRRLPTAWQEVLWYTEVEGMRPRQVGPLLGMNANAVAALAYRAREGLRQSWIQIHLSTLSEDSECRWTVEHLGAKLRGRLSKSDLRRVNDHLEDCTLCPIVAEEAADANRRIALILLPLAAGVGGAAAYTAWQSTSAGSAAVAAEVVPNMGHGAVGWRSIRAQALVITAAVVAASALGVSVSVALAGGPSRSENAPFSAAADPTSTPSAQEAPPAQPSAPKQTPAPVAPQPAPPAPAPVASPLAPSVSVTVPAAPGAVAASPVNVAPPPPTIPPTSPIVTLSPKVLSPAAGSIVTSDAFTVTGSGTPGALITVQLSTPTHTATLPAVSSSVDRSGAWRQIVNVADLPDGTYELHVQEALQGATTATTVLTIEIIRRPDTPVIATVDTGDGPNSGTLYPLIFGSSLPGATISLTAAGTSTATTADQAGHWSAIAEAGMTAGINTLAITQTDAQGSTSPPVVLPITLSVPTIAVTNRPSAALITGTPLATIQVAVGAGGWAAATLDETGTVSVPVDFHQFGQASSILVRYAAEGRYGPAITVSAPDRK
ncbi:sigma-70 family RNA polymerase sigma factor [Leifsonia sp. NPDC056665]|uniref:sigma-70 family RNA polymerase sigma factor n=1 Tax=Leifsonia sp. NPDC056665 TaxID=3345901 RepID=UPI00367F592F